MVYRAEVRCPCKPNGLQVHSGRRSSYDDARGRLQGWLYDHYKRPKIITGECVLFYAVWLKDARAGDCSGYLAGLEDTIQGHMLSHAFPILLNDRQIVGHSWFPQYGRCLFTGAGYDAVEFEVVEI